MTETRHTLPRCPSTWDGMSCDFPEGHLGAHESRSNGTLAFWVRGDVVFAPTRDAQ